MMEEPTEPMEQEFNRLCFKRAIEAMSPEQLQLMLIEFHGQLAASEENVKRLNDMLIFSYEQVQLYQEQLKILLAEKLRTDQ